MASVVSIYSHLQDGSEELGIQTLASFESGYKIPIGFTSLVDTEAAYSIQIDQREGQLSEVTVYLVDNVLGTIHDITNEPYVFRAGKSTQWGRFTLQFERSSLNTAGFNVNSVSVFPNPTQDVLNLVSSQSPITGIVVYDVQGRRVMTLSEDASNSVQLSMVSLEAAMYFVTIETEGGSLTKQVIKN